METVKFNETHGSLAGAAPHGPHGLGGTGKKSAASLLKARARHAFNYCAGGKIERHGAGTLPMQRFCRLFVAVVLVALILISLHGSLPWVQSRTIGGLQRGHPAMSSDAAEYYYGGESMASAADLAVFLEEEDSSASARTTSLPSNIIFDAVEGVDDMMSATDEASLLSTYEEAEEHTPSYHHDDDAEVITTHTLAADISSAAVATEEELDEIHDLNNPTETDDSNDVGGLDIGATKPRMGGDHRRRSVRDILPGALYIM